jgi:hypothetical protein
MKKISALIVQKPGFKMDNTVADSSLRIEKFKVARGGSGVGELVLEVLDGFWSYLASAGGANQQTYLN